MGVHSFRRERNIAVVLRVDASTVAGTGTSEPFADGSDGSLRTFRRY
jgi:hypothetical protein